MDNLERLGTDERVPPEAMEKAIQDVEKQEQLYSIGLFDILGFSNFVQNNGNQVILGLYYKLLALIHRLESSYTGGAAFSGSVVPAPVSAD